MTGMNGYVKQIGSRVELVNVDWPSTSGESVVLFYKGRIDELLPVLLDAGCELAGASMEDIRAATAEAKRQMVNGRFRMGGVVT